MVKGFSCLLLAVLTCAAARSQDVLPTIYPTANYTDSEGTEQSETSVSEAAPLTVTFKPGTENADGWSEYYEWRFYRENDRTTPYLTRYEEETTYTFNDAGAHYIYLYATFTQGNDTVNYTSEYWNNGEGQPIVVSISESRLEFPNAFSPNGDGINDVYKAKPGWQSIVEFKATIFNRWGQKIYSWTDPAGGWDGKWHGKDVAQGVYYVLVKARGADGRKFNIKKDVNLLRGYTETDTYDQ